MNKKETILFVCVGLLAVFGIAFGYNKYQENQKLKAINQKQKKDILVLLDEYLKLHQQDLPEPIKQLIVNLRVQYKGVDEKVAEELYSIEKLITIGDDEGALQKLAKIIENLLKDRFVQENQENTKIPTFHKLLEYAKEHSWIEEDSFQFCCAFKVLRNHITHELAVKVDDKTKTEMFIGGISLIYNLKGIRNE